jgi:hypothetical protein
MLLKSVGWCRAVFVGAGQCFSLGQSNIRLCGSFPAIRWETAEAAGDLKLLGI